MFLVFSLAACSKTDTTDTTDPTDTTDVVDSEPDTGEEDGGILELTTEVVVVGAGGTGLAAAASAYEHGAEVIVVEKMAFVGGSTALSGGGIGATGTRFQKNWA